MRTKLVVAGLALVGVMTAINVVRADECTPAMCAGISPACWLAYERIMTLKGQEIPSERKCKEMAEGDAKAFGAWLKVQSLDTPGAICACAAAYWSLQGVAQGLPDWD